MRLWSVAAGTIKIRRLEEHQQSVTSISQKMVTRKLSPQTSLIQPTEVDYSIEAAR